MELNEIFRWKFAVIDVHHLAIALHSKCRGTSSESNELLKNHNFSDKTVWKKISFHFSKIISGAAPHENVNFEIRAYV